jgi:hypothetical protein
VVEHLSSTSEVLDLTSSITRKKRKKEERRKKRKKERREEGREEIKKGGKRKIERDKTFTCIIPLQIL